MTALTKDRNTLVRDGIIGSHPVAAAAIIYAGAIVCLDAAGNAVPGSTATTLTAIGRAEARADNAGGAAGDINVEVRKGVFKYANDGVDTIDRTHIGATAYIVDDQTVAANDGTGTRSAAGQIVQVDSDGVWVEFS